jgi:Ca-activated chloride channel family protein
MTDGVNNGGEVSPLKAAELAVTNHLKIYTIGIGADEIIRQDWFGHRYREKQFIDLDERTLIKIAESTGGCYYRARNSEELQNIYLLLDKLEPIEKEKQYFRPRRELYVYPLALALCLAAAIALSRVRLS